jgi:hypothetical protein
MVWRWTPVVRASSASLMPARWVYSMSSSAKVRMVRFYHRGG